MLKVTLVKSVIGAEPRNRKTVAALGLNKRGRTRLLPDNEAVRGMIHHVKHLVTFEVVEEGDYKPKARGKKAAAKNGAAPKAEKKAAPKAGAKTEAKAEAKAEKAEEKTEAKKPAAKKPAAKKAASTEKGEAKPKTAAKKPAAKKKTEEGDAS